MVKVAKMINVICKLKTLYAVNRSVSQPYYAIFFILYVGISVFAFMCNSLLLISLFHYNKKKKSGFKRKTYYFTKRIQTKLTENGGFPN